jgi:hypothetical protein
MGQRWLDGYSAHVEIYVLIRGKRYDIAQIGGSSFILRGSPDIAPDTSATLVVKVDGEEERQEIVICGNVRHEEPVSFF